MIDKYKRFGAEVEPAMRAVSSGIGGRVAAQAPTVARGLRAAGDLVAPAARFGMRALGPALVAGNEALQAAPTFRDPTATGLDKASAVSRGVGRGAATLAGAGLGAAAGSVVPIVGTALGGMAGGALGYLGGDRAISYGRRLLGVEDPERPLVPTGPQTQGIRQQAATPPVASAIPADDYVTRRDDEGMPVGMSDAPRVSAPVARRRAVLSPAAAPLPQPNQSGMLAGISEVQPHIDDAIAQANQNPQQAAADADAIEQHTGTPLDALFASMMQRYSQPVPQGLTRGEMGNLLMRFGLSTMVAASQPGAQALGAIGQGGLAALDGFGALKDQRTRLQAERDKGLFETGKEMISNRRADVQDRRAAAYEKWRDTQALQQQRASDLMQQRLQVQQEYNEARTENERRRLDQQFQLIQSQIAANNARAGYLGAREEHVGEARPLSPVDQVLKRAQTVKALREAYPTKEDAELERMADGNLGASALPASPPSTFGAPPPGYRYEQRGNQWGLVQEGR